MQNPTTGDLEKQFEAIQKQMNAAGLSELAIRTFRYYYLKLAEDKASYISEKMLRPLPEPQALDELQGYEEAGKAALSQTVAINLNGGLGTSMGLDKAKSLLPAKDELSFLDIIVKQTLTLRKQHNANVPLVFMNSFRTEADTIAALSKFEDFEAGQDQVPSSFVQNKVPKICQDTFLPVSWPEDPSLEWCPPGHGDLYTAMMQTELLDNLLAKNYRYAFVSNADNLGAVLDLNILGYFASKELPFMMEVTDRTEADKKGGHVALDANGRLLLREVAQCAPEEINDFQDITKHRYFNTNSLWIDLQALKAKMDENDGILGLPFVKNSKTVDPRDAASPKVFQLETVMGTALSIFDKASVLRVPRSRFIPVKTTNDLLDLWSDIFVLDDAYQLKLNPARKDKKIVIDLDPAYYKKIDDFQARFPFGAPSLVNCKSLKVKGDVLFSKNVTAQGSVEIENNNETQLIIADGELLK